MKTTLLTLFLIALISGNIFALLSGRKTIDNVGNKENIACEVKRFQTNADLQEKIILT